jgi:hypothetical protein
VVLTQLLPQSLVVVVRFVTRSVADDDEHDADVTVTLLVPSPLEVPRVRLMQSPTSALLIAIDVESAVPVSRADVVVVDGVYVGVYMLRAIRELELDCWTPTMIMMTTAATAKVPMTIPVPDRGGTTAAD